MLGHIEDGVDHLKVAQADVATLSGQCLVVANCSGVISMPEIACRNL
jgi:hypothetical protein